MLSWKKHAIFRTTPRLTSSAYFHKEKGQELKNSVKLTWQSAHVPLNASVCSNVPEYRDPNFLVSNRDRKEFITEFIQYLISIRTKSSSLLCKQYAPVFQALNHAAVSSRVEAQEDQLGQILVDIQEEGQQVED